MSKVAIISDTHWGARNNSLIFLNYMKWWWREVFFPYCKENGITDVIHGGDFFDNRNNLNLLTMFYVKRFFLPLLDEYDVKLHIIPGNHDLYYRNDSEVTSLEVMRESFRALIYEEPTDVKIGDTTFFLCPWINKNNYDDTLKAMDNSSASVMVGHLEVAGFKMYKHSVAEEGMDRNLFKKFDRVFSGHFHHPSTIGNITYLGSPFHITWQDYNDARGFVVYDTESGEHEYVENETCLFTRIVYDDSNGVNYKKEPVDDLANRFVELVVEKKEKAAAYKDFVSRIHEVDTWSFEIIDKTELDISDLDIEVDAATMKHDTLTLTKHYINNAVDETEAKLTTQFVEEIYAEAVDLRSKGE